MDVMQCVYQGSGPTDAHLVHHWLVRNEVRAAIRGMHRMGLGGEVPVNEAWPSVWVGDEDVERARALITEFEGPKLVHPRWLCAACGEDNEPNFGSCWNCGADRP
jgi:hypothetical protein